METSEIISILKEDFLDRDGETFVKARKEGRLGWENGLSSGAYSEYMLRPASQEELIRNAYSVAKDMITAMDTPFRVKISITGKKSATDGRTVFVRDKDKALELCRAEAGTLVQWASKLDLKLCAAAREQQIPLLFIEDGFIRSVGLGSDHFRPFSLALDKHGIYYDPQSHSDLERLLNALPRRPDLAQLKERARRLITFLTAGGLTKYNVGSSGDVLSRRIRTLAQGRKVILVPGQVEGDASIKASNTGISTNLELLQAVRASHQHAFIIFKIHPDVWAQNRPGLKLTEQYRTYADLIAADCSIADLYATADEVCVLSSQSGFEALLRRRPVTVYGRPFYAGWGLTQDKESFPRRTALLSLEELAAGVLLLYPRYYDWQTGMFCRAEDVCRRLEAMKGQKRAWSFFMR